MLFLRKRDNFLSNLSSNNLSLSINKSILAHDIRPPFSLTVKEGGGGVVFRKVENRERNKLRESGISDEMSSVALEPFILGNLSNNVTLEIRVHFRGHGGWAGESWGKMCRDQSVG